MTAGACANTRPTSLTERGHITMKKTNRVQPAIAGALPWRAGCYVAEFGAATTTPGQLRNAVLFSDALLARLMRRGA